MRSQQILGGHLHSCGLSQIDYSMVSRWRRRAKKRDGLRSRGRPVRALHIDFERALFQRIIIVRRRAGVPVTNAMILGFARNLKRDDCFREVTLTLS